MGFEPIREYSPPPQDGVSANSTTTAIGARDRNRTYNLLSTNQLRYQLRHTGIFGRRIPPYQKEIKKMKRQFRSATPNSTVYRLVPVATYLLLARSCVYMNGYCRLPKYIILYKIEDLSGFIQMHHLHLHHHLAQHIFWLFHLIHVPIISVQSQ